MATRRWMALVALLAFAGVAGAAASAHAQADSTTTKPKKAKGKKQPAAKPAPEPTDPEPAPAPTPTPEPAKPPPEPAPAPPTIEPPPPPAPEILAPPPWYKRPIGHAGGYLQLGVGFARWVLNQDKVAAQVRERDDVSLFFNPLRDGIAGSLRGGYNVFGHGHIGFNFLATGWDITNSSRGGGGYIGGEIGWHPISLAELFLKDGLLKDKWYDFWLETGCGYGIVGKDRAMDGLVASFGLGTEGFPAPWVSIGLRITWYFPFFGRYIRDYDNRDLPGNTIDLPDKSGGKFFALTGHINFHFGAP